MAEDKIRARLDELRENPAQFSRAFDLDAALRAVLDELDHAPRTPTAQHLAQCVRHRIAEALGVGTP